MLHMAKAKGPADASLLVQFAVLLALDMAAMSVVITSAFSDGCPTLALAGLALLAVLVATLGVVWPFGRR